MLFLVPVCAQWVAGSPVHAHTVGVCFSREATERADKLIGELHLA